MAEGVAVSVDTKRGMDPKNELYEIVNEATGRIIDLNFGFPLATGWAALSSSIHTAELTNFMEQFPKSQDGSFDIPIEKFSEMKQMMRRESAADAYAHRFPGFYVSAIIEELDLYVGKLVKYILNNSPDDSRLKDKSISYSDLMKFRTFDEAKKSLIDNEVDSVLRQGIAGQIEWMNKYASLNIPMNHEFVLRAIELGERRNCIVHADGRANRQYITKCSERNVDIGETKEGDKLRPDIKYCQGAFETSLIICTMIFAALWIKYFKKVDQNWDFLLETLNEIVYDLMVDEKWSAAKSLAVLTLRDFKINPSGMNEKILIINHALCELETEGKDAMLAILNRVDWRGSDLSFQASVAALKGNADEAIGFIKRGFRAEEIDKTALIEWPVFNRIRKLKKFREAYIELLGDDEADTVFLEKKDPAIVGPGVRKAVNEAFKQLEGYTKRKDAEDETLTSKAERPRSQPNPKAAPKKAAPRRGGAKKDSKPEARADPGAGKN
jgi:hypothetical protein